MWLNILLTLCLVAALISSHIWIYLWGSGHTGYLRGFENGRKVGWFEERIRWTQSVRGWPVHIDHIKNCDERGKHHD